MNFTNAVKELKLETPLLVKKINELSSLSDGDVDLALIELLKFLNLIGTVNRRLSPSQIIDTVWHEFILFTKQYIQFCEKHWGRVIHHEPSESASTALYFQTLEEYEELYGKGPEKYWPLISEASDSRCGSCEMK